MSTHIIYFGLIGFLGLAVLRRPSVALAAILCMFGLEQWAQSKQEFYYEHNLLTNVLAAGLLGWAILVKPVKGQGIFTHYPKVAFVIAGLFAWSAVSILWSQGSGFAVDNWKGHAPYLLTIIALLPLAVATLDDLRGGLMMTLAVGSVILGLLLFDTEWRGREISLQRGVMMGTIVSDHGNPLAVASLAGWVALIALLLNFRGLGRPWQVARWGVMAMALLVSFRSGSRGQLFALLVAGIAFLPVSRRLENFKGVMSTAVAVGVVLLLASALYDGATGGANRWNMQTMVDTYRGGRLGAAEYLLGAWLGSNPAFWLIGLGTSASYPMMGGYPHVVMAEVLGELGVVGFVLLWLVVIYSGQSLLRMYRLVRDAPVERGLVAALGAMFLFEVILSFKQGSMLGSYYAFAFAIILGRIEGELTARAREHAAWQEWADGRPDDGVLDYYGGDYAHGGRGDRDLAGTFASYN